MKDWVWCVGFVVLTALATSRVQAASVSEVDFPESQSCVAWKTQKTFAFIRTVTVVGKNCQVSAEVIPEPDDHFHLEISIPIAGFESGEAERDREVAQMLKADVAKNLEFVSESISLPSWQEKIVGGEFDLKGHLKIGNKKYNIKIDVSRTAESSVFVGRHKSKFERFDLTPPKLLGGLGARVGEQLELLFQLDTNQVLGAQSILKIPQ